MASTTDRAGERLAEAASLLATVAGDAQVAGQLLALLGWELPPGVADIGLTQLDVSALASHLDDLATLRSLEGTSDLEEAAAVGEVVAALAAALAHVEDVAQSLEATPEYLRATNIAAELFPRLADFLLVQAVGWALPVAVPVGALLGLFELTPMAADPSIFQAAHLRHVVHWDRFSSLLTDPGGLLREVYGWGGPEFDAQSLLTNLGRVLDYVTADVSLVPFRREAEEELVGHPVPQADATPGTQLLVTLDDGLVFDSFNVGVTLFSLRPSSPGGTDGGIGLSPYAYGTAESSFPLSDTLSVVLSGSTAIQGGLGLMLRAGHDPELLTGLIDAPGDGEPPASFGVALRSAAVADGRQVLFSAPSLHFDAAAVMAGVNVTTDGDFELLARIEDGRIRLVPDGADGFLASILPGDGIETSLNVTIKWSSRDGLHIEGGAGLHATIPLNLRLGPLELEALDFGLTGTRERLTGVAAVTGTASLGPFAASLDRIGAAVALRFQRGNLGSLELGADFVPPAGISLALHAGAVTGGGFLFLDPERGQYSGAVSLEVSGLALKAFGLLSTRLPGGRPGYSLLVVISAEFTPIALGMGFTLNGVGGLVAMNRTVSVEALRAGLKAGSLASVFADPTAHAGELLGNLESLFPIATGRHLFGPIARIGWGTPTVITIDLCLVWEFPAPERLVVLGQLRAVLPDEREPVVRLKMELLGVIDFDRRQAAVDATLVDSRVASFVVTGDMAMRLSWGTQPSFLLAVGGFHPRFLPPQGFPSLKRVTVALATGDNPRLRLEAYLAITANTLQFGARVDLLVKKGPFTLAGFLSFDALVVLRPLGFEVDLAAHLSVKAGSRTVVSVSLALTLSGPSPWRARGKASFSLLFIDVTFRFDVTIGARAALPPPESVDAGGLVRAALADVRSWAAQLPVGGQSVVSLRHVVGGSDILAHPLGTLEVRQRVAPLDRTLERFGPQVPVGTNRVAILGASIRGRTSTVDHLDDLFAPGQFEELTDDERLSRPSFEPMRSGVRIGDADVAHGRAVPVEVVFEQRIVSAPDAPPEDPSIARLPVDVLVALASSATGHAATAPTDKRPAFGIRRLARSSPVV